MSVKHPIIVITGSSGAGTSTVGGTFEEIFRRESAVPANILRRMPDYINYICPQFSEMHVNFQRVPIVDTSNPFTARHIPSRTKACW